MKIAVVIGVPGGNGLPLLVMVMVWGTAVVGNVSADPSVKSVVTLKQNDSAHYATRYRSEKTGSK